MPMSSGVKGRTGAHHTTESPGYHSVAKYKVTKKLVLDQVLMWKKNGIVESHTTDLYLLPSFYFALCHIDGLMQTGTRLCSNVLSLRPLIDLASRALLVKSSTAISRGYFKWALLQTINNLGQRAGKITEDHYISQADR